MARFLFDDKHGNTVGSFSEKTMGIQKTTIITLNLIDTMHLWDSGTLVLVDDDGNITDTHPNMELVWAHTEFVDGLGWIWVYEFTG